MFEDKGGNSWKLTLAQKWHQTTLENCQIAVVSRTTMWSLHCHLDFRDDQLNRRLIERTENSNGLLFSINWYFIAKTGLWKLLQISARQKTLQSTWLDLTDPVLKHKSQTSATNQSVYPTLYCSQLDHPDLRLKGLLCGWWSAHQLFAD